MKNPGFLLLLAFVLIFTACQPFQEEDKIVILNGKIENPNTELLIFTVSDLPEDLIKDTVYLNEDGTFKTSFELPECRPVRLYDGKESTQMYLCPGDSVFITLNTEEFDESLHYEGNGAKKNNILAEYYLKFKDFENKDFISFYKIKDTTTSIYIELVNTTADKTSNYFDQLKEQNELPPEFISYMETDIYFNKISNLQYLSYSSKKDTTEEYKALINGVGDITLDAVKFENPDYLNQNYQAWLKYNISRQLNREIFEEYEKPDKAVYDSIFYTRLQQLLTPFELQLYLFNKTASLARSYNVEGFEIIMPLVEQYVTDQEYKDAITKQYEEVVRKLSQPLPEDAMLYNLDDEDLLDLGFEDVLARYKGNVIYLDFWASWCGPCKSEMPNSAKLAKKLQDEDVVFLYVSTDKDSLAWERMIRIMQLHGLHYRLGANTRKPVFEEYGIRYIPHYVLIDKDGNMVKNNMSRPGDVETEKMIRELL